MRLFLGGRCYTAEKLEKDYLAEVANYSDDRWEAPQRAARLAAAVKRYKTSEMLRFIFATIAYDPDPDWGSAPISSKSLTLSIKTIIYHVVNRHIRTQYLRYHLVGLLPPKDCPNL